MSVKQRLIGLVSSLPACLLAMVVLESVPQDKESGLSKFPGISFGFGLVRFGSVWVGLGWVGLVGGGGSRLGGGLQLRALNLSKKWPQEPSGRPHPPRGGEGGSTVQQH